MKLRSEAGRTGLPGREIGRRPFWLSWVFAAALVLYATVTHHGVGPPPEGIARHWYEPTTLLHRLDLISFAFDSGICALGCLTLPAALLAVGVFVTGRSALARAISLSCGVAVATAGFAVAGARAGSGAIGARTAALLLGLLVAAGLLALGSQLGAFPFELGAKTLLGAAAFCVVTTVAVSTVGTRRDEGALRRRARWIAVGAALAGVPILAGEVLARVDYYVTREHRAREITDALGRYFEREFLYPDALEDLVAAEDIEGIPEPAIGFGFLTDARFRYQSFGTSFILEFPAPRWVECAYTPPYVDEDSEDEEAHEAEGGTEDQDGEVTAAESDEFLGESWSCPSKPPELW